MATLYSFVTSPRALWLRRAAVPLLMAVVLTGCAPKRGQIPVGVTQPDKYLFEQGTAALEERRWFTAREYFQQLVDGYPQSPYRAEGKLGVGDAYLGDGTIEGKLRAEREFQEFLAYFPTHPRADYAQYRLAMTHYEQMPKAERDQTATKAALEQFALFRERYPNSALMPEVLELEREARDRLSMSSYRVGLYYHRARWYPGAVARFRDVIVGDPQYTHRDAVYYHLAEALVELRREAEALPYLDRLKEEFVESEFLADGERLATRVRATLAQRTPDDSGAESQTTRR
jgi:outer membrane protein assembly factor BamD